MSYNGQPILTNDTFATWRQKINLINSETFQIEQRLQVVELGSGAQFYLVGYSNANGTDFAFDSATSTITTGTTDLSGVSVGDKLYISGSSLNDGQYTVTAAGANSITVAETLQDEAAGQSVTAHFGSDTWGYGYNVFGNVAYTGSDNIAIGSNAADELTNGGGNVLIGNGAGSTLGNISAKFVLAHKWDGSNRVQLVSGDFQTSTFEIDANTFNIKSPIVRTVTSIVNTATDGFALGYAASIDGTRAGVFAGTACSALGDYSVTIGGSSIKASSRYDVAAGGQLNETSVYNFGTQNECNGVFAGSHNTIDDLGTVASHRSVIVGGQLNIVHSTGRSISLGGYNNGISESTDSLISGYANQIQNAQNSAIFSGKECTISYRQTTILNGWQNDGDGEYNVILNGAPLNEDSANGRGNRIYGRFSLIGNGQDNRIGRANGTVKNDSENSFNFIANGFSNNIEGYSSSILSGSNNTVSRNGSVNTLYYSSVLSGSYNSIISQYANTSNSSILAGASNVLDSCAHSVVLAGSSNTITNSNQSVVSGQTNTVNQNSHLSFTIGEMNGVNGTHQYTFGKFNSAIGLYKNFLFGESIEVNLPSGGHSLCFGSTIKCVHNSQILLNASSGDLSGYTNKYFSEVDTGGSLAWGENQFRVKATGGISFTTGVDANFAETAGVYLSAGASSWLAASDKNRKESYTEIDHTETVDKVRQLPVEQWNYIGQESVKNIGPYAQDFHKAFDFGDVDKLGISTQQIDGVTLSAVKGLIQLVDDMRMEIDELKQRVAKLEGKK